MDIVSPYLLNKPFPKLSFNSTSGIEVPGSFRFEWTVIYVHPMILSSFDEQPKGWMNIPGAAGCTDQSCLFRDVYDEMSEINTKIFGISNQTTFQQKAAKERLGLPFDLISDEKLLLKKLLHLPTFKVDGKEYYERLTLILKQGIIQKVCYPVKQPGENLHEVYQFILSNQKE